MSADSEPPALLSIGINSGGTSAQNRLIHEGLGAVQRLVIRKRVALPNEGLRINIVFHIPGPMFQPDYEGVHATRLDRKHNHLLVVAAVPSALPPDDVPAYAATVLKAAAREARDYVSAHKIPVTLGRVESLITQLAIELEGTTA